METGLAGKCVIVTGGSANAGRAIALAFAHERAVVVVASRDETAGRRVADLARSHGASSSAWIGTDVLEPAHVERMVDETIERFGGIDVLVNTVGGAGTIDNSPFWGTTDDEWKVEVDLTLTSVLNCSRSVLPHMIRRGHGGRIINIGSTSGFTGDVGMAVYSAAKGAVHTFTTVLAREVGEYGITVNAVAPWLIMPEDVEEETSPGSRWNPDTGRFFKLGLMNADARDVLKTRTLLGAAQDRPAVKPSEVGAATVYFASDAASFVTAQVLVIDGGMMLTLPT